MDWTGRNKIKFSRHRGDTCPVCEDGLFTLVADGTVLECRCCNLYSASGNTQRDEVIIQTIGKGFYYPIEDDVEKYERLIRIAQVEYLKLRIKRLEEKSDERYDYLKTLIDE